MLFDEVKTGYTYDDLLLVTRYSEVKSRKDPSLYSELVPGLGFDIPVISANMSKITESKMIKSMCDFGATGVLHRFLHPDQVVKIINECKDKKRKFGISIGVDEDYYSEVLNELYHSGAIEHVSFIVIDVAHGHHKLVGDTIQNIKVKFFCDIPIVAGNVATGEGALYLAECGANVIKVGIGPGASCITRQVTGFGYPQLSAVREVYEVFKTINNPPSIIADGGIRHTGDIVKALAAGADFVMLGGMLAGTRETPGNVLTMKGKKYKLFEGMASINSQATFFNKESDEIIPEGETAFVPYKGSVYQTMFNIKGAVKAGLSYAGCNSIKEIQNFGNNPGNWVKVTNAGYVEGTPHGI